MRILVIDSFDSFTFNLVHTLETHPRVHCTVMTNNAIDWTALTAFNAVVLSPGPGIPEEAGDLIKCIDVLKAQRPILGVCLGMQAIGQFFGARLINLKQVFHGLARPVYITRPKDPLFTNCTNPFVAARYHSWGLDPESVKEPLEITAQDAEGRVMGIRRLQHNICGLQFHPESILSPQGTTLLHNWINTYAHG